MVLLGMLRMTTFRWHSCYLVNVQLGSHIEFIANVRKVELIMSSTATSSPDKNKNYLYWY